MLQINEETVYRFQITFLLGESPNQNSAENTVSSLLCSTSYSVALTVVTDGQHLFPKKS